MVGKDRWMVDYCLLQTTLFYNVFFVTYFINFRWDWTCCIFEPHFLICIPVIRAQFSVIKDFSEVKFFHIMFINDCFFISPCTKHLRDNDQQRRVLIKSDFLVSFQKNDRNSINEVLFYLSCMTTYTKIILKSWLNKKKKIIQLKFQNILR